MGARGLGQIATVQGRAEEEEIAPDPRPHGDRVSLKLAPERIAAIALAALLVAIDIGLILTVRLRTWTLVLPVLTLIFAVLGPRPRLAPWRDAILLIGLLSIVAVAFLPHRIPARARWAVNTPGTAALVLLCIAYLHGDGLGAALRERSLPKFRRAMSLAGHAFAGASGLLLSCGVVAYGLELGTIPRGLVLLASIAVLGDLAPQRWPILSRWSNGVGCLGFFVALIGAALARWPWSTFLFYLFAFPLGNELKKLVRLGAEDEPDKTPESVSTSRFFRERGESSSSTDEGQDAHEISPLTAPPSEP